jgi:hypothetical protein
MINYSGLRCHHRISNSTAYSRVEIIVFDRQPLDDKSYFSECQEKCGSSPKLDKNPFLRLFFDFTGFFLGPAAGLKPELPGKI